MIEVSNVRLPLDAGLPEGEGIARSSVANALGVKVGDVEGLQLLKRSVDARKRNDVGFVATYAVSLVDAALESEIAEGRRSVSKRVNVRPHVPYEALEVPWIGRTGQLGDALGADADAAGAGREPRPVVVGTGPAGLFAALYLARAGLRPIVLERGGDVDERMRAVDAFNAGENLDLATNVQFGEGGAGTFSDGKLTTGTKSPLARHVLQWFVDAGAPEEILWQAKPHIGTDKLVDVVRTMRSQIVEAGGDVLFHVKLEDLRFGEDGRLREAVVSGPGLKRGLESGALRPLTELGEVAGAGSAAGGADPAGAADGAAPVSALIPCASLVLACGHSARDTFRMLQRANLAMEPKPFSVGVRIEHRQADIDRAQYGKAAGHPALGAADYKMVAHLPGGRSVYTFCMCPGGEVVAAASEEYGVVVNGMSRFARDAENANAALLVGVVPDDFRSSDPLAGTVFQRRIEQAAFGEAHELGGDAWQAPAQTVGDFLADEAGNPSPTVRPSYARGVVWCDLREVLPEFVSDAIAEALPLLDRKLRGFADPGAVMTGVETRSSSPVRILRGDGTLQAWRKKPGKRVRPRDIARGHGRPEPEQPQIPCGIYPAGEGPGYAGGIMSAAVDGLRIAGKLAEDIALARAAAVLEAGRAAVFPTDTVYGLGVSALHAPSPDEIFALKGRDAGKPVAWLVPGPEALDEYGADVPADARELAERHWPGALTIIVKAGPAVPEAFRSEAGTIGLRMPDSPQAQALLRAVGGPLATSSANLSGADAPASWRDVDPALLSRVGAAVPAAAVAGGRASTVVDCSQGETLVVRQGAVRI